jgi:hypothetical protein
MKHYEDVDAARLRPRAQAPGPRECGHTGLCVVDAGARGCYRGTLPERVYLGGCFWAPRAPF